MELKDAVKAGALVLRAPEHGTHPGVKNLGSQLAGLNAAGYWDASTDLDFGRWLQKMREVQFNYLFRGRLDLQVDAEAFTMYPGQIALTRPGQTLKIGKQTVSASRLGWVVLDVGWQHARTPWTWPDWVLLSAAERARLTRLLRQADRACWKADASISEAFERIAQAAAGSGDKHFDRTGMALAINELLLGVLKMLERHADTNGESPTLQRVERFLDGLPGRAGEPWTVDTMAEECGIRRSRFTSLCEELYNQTPARYLNKCRVAAACRLLRENPGKSVLDVALECGFTSSQMFATAFRRVKGLTPREFRRLKS